MEIPYTVEPRPDTGLYNAKVGIWLFLASEVMLFGALFSSYILLRVGAPEGYWPRGWLNVPLGTVNTLVLITSSITTVMAWASCKMNQFGRFKVFHACTLLLAMTFVCIKSYEYHDKFTHYEITLKDGRIADGHMVANDPKADHVVISGRYVADRKDLYDLEVRKAPHHHEESEHPREARSRRWNATAPGTTPTWPFISPSPACTRCTSSAAPSSSASSGGRAARCGKPTRSASPTASKSPACSGTLSIWSGFSCSLCYT